jgi:cell wall integrity and stress response component
MPPAAPPKFSSPLTTSPVPTPTASKDSPDHGFESDNLTLKDGAAAPTPAPAVFLNREAGPQYYITLTITDPAEVTYTTTILLGNDYPGASPTDPVQQSASTQTITAAATQNPGLSSGSVAGIIIGVLGGLAVLAAVFYVWMIRARQGQPEPKKRRRHRKKKKKTTWFNFKFKFQKGKKRRRSRRSSTSTGGKWRLHVRLGMSC